MMIISSNRIRHAVSSSLSWMILMMLLSSPLLVSSLMTKGGMTKTLSIITTQRNNNDNNKISVFEQQRKVMQQQRGNFVLFNGGMMMEPNLEEEDQTERQKRRQRSRWRDEERSWDRSYWAPEEEYEKQQQEEEETSIDMENWLETETELEVLGDIDTDKPKIVVLGASGRIGSLVINELMNQDGLEISIVGVARNMNKTIKALYGEEAPYFRPSFPTEDDSEKKKGPSLQLVAGDIVPSNRLPLSLKKQEKEWKRRAKSAAKFFKTSWRNYDDTITPPGNRTENDVLETVLKNATVVISCLGDYRGTNLWTDLIQSPFGRRFFWSKRSKENVWKWCNDAKHPYYVHYETTLQTLFYLEEEQKQRDEALIAKKEAERQKEERQKQAEEENDTEAIFLMSLESRLEELKIGFKKKESNEFENRRIRLIRISDLMLSRKPYNFESIFTNLFQSMIFRYQDMAERLLEESPHIDTITLRPGLFIDDTTEQRDPDATHVQVSESGSVPYPSLVGREDVAALAVAAALFPSNSSITATTTTTNNDDNPIIDQTALTTPKEGALNDITTAAETNSIIATTTNTTATVPQPFHMSLGVRWCGKLESPNKGKPQGKKTDGYQDSYRAMQQIIRPNKKINLQPKTSAVATTTTTTKQNNDPLESFRKQLIDTTKQKRGFFSFLRRSQRRKLKPYSIFAAIPMYLGIAYIVTNLLARLSFLNQNTHLQYIGTLLLQKTNHCWKLLLSIIANYQPNTQNTVISV